MDNLIYFKSIKKANCHLHITGSLNADDLRSLSKFADVDVSQHEPLEDKYNFHNSVVWEIAKDITSSKQGFCEAIKIVLNREAADNVSYLEITFNPFGMIRRGMTPELIRDCLVGGVRYGKKIGVVVKYKFGVNRKDGPESTKVVEAVYQISPDSLRIGIDLNGDERSFYTADFIEVFSDLRLRGIPTSIHAGEYLDCLDSLRSALKTKPNRIVHAIAGLNNAEIVEEFEKEGIILEMSTISNLSTGSLGNKDDHPIKKVLGNRNIKLVLGSDDPAFFNNSMSIEMDFLTKMGIETQEILDMNNRTLAMFLQV